MSDEYKRCGNCLKNKSKSLFFKCKQNIDGLRHECRECYRNKYVKLKPKKQLAEYCVAEKVCQRCDVLQIYKNFVILKSNKKDGLFKFCKTCCLEEMKEHDDFKHIDLTTYIFPLFLKKTDKPSNDFRKYCKSKNKKETIKKWMNRPLVVERRKNQNEQRRITGKLKQYRETYYKNKPQAKIAMNMRGRIRGILLRQAQSKKGRTYELLGCSWNELKCYLENKFLPGMSWDNYKLDGWHIDHIIPCINFDLSKKEEQQKCFHYTNLQPLWCKDNLAKRWSDRELYKK